MYLLRYPCFHVITATVKTFPATHYHNVRQFSFASMYRNASLQSMLSSILWRFGPNFCMYSAYLPVFKLFSLQWRMFSATFVVHPASSNLTFLCVSPQRTSFYFPVSIPFVSHIFQHFRCLSKWCACSSGLGLFAKTSRLFTCSTFTVSFNSVSSFTPSASVPLYLSFTSTFFSPLPIRTSTIITPSSILSTNIYYTTPVNFFPLFPTVASMLPSSTSSSKCFYNIFLLLSFLPSQYCLSNRFFGTLHDFPPIQHNLFACFAQSLVISVYYYIHRHFHIPSSTVVLVSSTLPISLQQCTLLPSHNFFIFGLSTFVFFFPSLSISIPLSTFLSLYHSLHISNEI